MVDTVGSPMGLYLKLASVSSNIGLASHIKWHEAIIYDGV